jgi:hypothetical protein
MNPLAVDQEEACRLLSCGPSKLSELREKGYLLPLWKGVYAVKDIEACVEKLREARGQNGTIINIHEQEGIPKKERAVGGERGRSGYRSPKVVLRENSG